MSPVRRRDLVVLAVGIAVASWLVVRAAYGSLPVRSWWLPLPLGVLALALALGARALRARLAVQRDRRPGPRGSVRPVEPMLVARLAVLAQASAYVGAVFAGVWGGLLLHALPSIGQLRAAGGDAVTGAIGVVLGAALVAAALWLEHVCKIPPEHDDEGTPGGARA
ncbi:DUF3180 domain-containing protein [Modestobacter roseus]|uniref:Uncharacterized protein DUF3180 n=1 Tax=Modestobacter roseus TaxID=1181884 RepID=A0A562IX91_9ACTN|nr:DUF3180 domain-containing protein [Modestobacter roseus]MQA34771.1 DUF3180 family protein [Modestobacter roseus]TWH75598.1 uncharacterized protein DUF3180 [Modestobacter roseus]